MQIPPGQAALPLNPVTPVAALPQAERVQMAPPARKVTASREGTETLTKRRSRQRGSDTAPTQPRGQSLDVLV